MLAAALLACALVLAQSAAIAHGYSHLKAPGEHLSAPGSVATYCADCLSFAPLLATAGGRGLSSELAAPHTASYRAHGAPLCAPSPRHSFLSRGPPDPV